MADLFLRIFNLSITAGYLVLAVVALRLLLKKAPRWSIVLLWGLVAIRLVCPFSIESALSLIPSAETVSPEIMYSPTPSINSGIHAFNSTINPVISETFAPTPSHSVNPMQVLIFVATSVWLVGMGFMLVYTLISYWRLQRRVSTAIRLQDNIYRSENVSSPFILGILRPRIYLSCHLCETERHHVIAHEQAHIRRQDHWWKPLGFLLLAIHWFNPLMWLAYILLCRDIEVACDEKVVKELETHQRADYSESLLKCSVKQTMIAACPLAFGEVGVKERVKNVLKYKKPSIWIIAISIAACIAIAVCFLTVPIVIGHGDGAQPGGSQTVTDVPGPAEVWYQIAGWYNRESGEFQVKAFPDVTFRWDGGKVEAVTKQGTTVIVDVLGIRNIGAADLNMDGYPEICVTADNLSGESGYYAIIYDYKAEKFYHFPSDQNRYAYHLYTEAGYLMCCKYPANNDGSDEAGRLMLTGTEGNMAPTIVVAPPPAEYNGDPVFWYDKNSPDSPLKAQVDLKAFPGVVFQWNHSPMINYETEGLVAIHNGVETELFPDGFVNSVYVADVTGDGKPDICANVYTSFSGFSSFNAVHVYDFANGCSYILSDAKPQDHYKNISYYLRLEDGKLVCDKVHVATSQVIATGTLGFDRWSMTNRLYLDHQVTYDSPVEYEFEGQTHNDRVSLIIRADGTFTALFDVRGHEDNDADWAHGTYTKEDGKLILSADDGRHFTFQIDGDNLIFVAKESSSLPKCCSLYDGALLIGAPYLTPEEIG